jgi:hypothetical protein
MALFNGAFYIKLILTSQEVVGEWAFQSTFFYSLMILLGVQINVATSKSDLGIKVLLLSSFSICFIGLLVLCLVRKDSLWLLLWVVTCGHFLLQSLVEIGHGFHSRSLALIVGFVPAVFVLFLVPGIFGLKIALLTFYLLSSFSMLYVVIRLVGSYSKTNNDYEAYFKVFGSFLLVSLPQIFLDPLIKSHMPTVELSSAGRYELVNKGLSQIRTIAASSLRHVLQTKDVKYSKNQFPLMLIGLVLHILMFNECLVIHFIVGSVLNVSLIKQYYSLMKRDARFLSFLGLANLGLVQILLSIRLDEVYFISAYLMSANAISVFIKSYVVNNPYRMS